MDEFNDSDISSLLNHIAGSSPDTMTAHKVVLGKVRRVHQRRVVAVSAAVVVIVSTGAVAMVQNSQNRDSGSNIAVPLSQGDSQPVDVSATNSEDVPTIPSETDAPNNSQGPPITTAPSDIPESSTTGEPPETTPQPSSQLPIATLPPPPTADPDVKTWICAGGLVKYRVTPNGLVVVETMAAPGFTISENKTKADEIVVKFISNSKNDERKSALKIKRSGLVSTSCEDEGFDRRSDASNSSSTNNGSSDNNEESADD